MPIILVTFGILIFGKLCLYEVPNILEETQNLPSDAIYAIPPTPAEDSDEYFGDEEDEAEQRDLNKLSFEREGLKFGKNSDSDSLLKNNISKENNSVILVIATSSKSTEKETSKPNTRQNNRVDFNENWKSMTTVSSDHAIFSEINSQKYNSLSPIKILNYFLMKKICT